MSAALASSQSPIAAGFMNSSTGHLPAGARKQLPATMFKSPVHGTAYSAYRRSAVLVTSDAAGSPPPPSSNARATTVCSLITESAAIKIVTFILQLHSFDLAAKAVSPSASPITYGIGVTLDKVGHGPNLGLPVIKQVLPNGCAFAKLACGDVVISVNGVLFDKSTPLKAAMQLIKGADDTFVDVTILRFHPVQFSDERLTFRLKRQPLQKLSPVVPRPPPSSTFTSTSDAASYTGVNLLTPRIDYPPDPPVQRPPYERYAQQWAHQHWQQLPQSQTALHHHTSAITPASESHNNLTLLNQQHHWQLQHHQALLALKLPSHQQQQLLLLQQQLNHLQQLSHQQQLATQLQQEHTNPKTPASPSAQRSTRLVLLSLCSTAIPFATVFHPFHPVSVPCSLSPGQSPHLVLFLLSPTLPLPPQPHQKLLVLKTICPPPFNQKTHAIVMICKKLSEALAPPSAFVQITHFTLVVTPSAGSSLRRQCHGCATTSSQ